MEPISPPRSTTSGAAGLFESDREIKYLRAVSYQKSVQRSGGDASRAQKKAIDRGRKYGSELVIRMMQAPHVIRKYAVGPKYVLECITTNGHITIYSHPRNPSVKPKMEVYHVRNGFITWWHEDELSSKCAAAWNDLCSRGGFDPADASEVLREEQRAAEIAALL